MRIAFISTVHGHKWPGSEYLWSDCAARLLKAGHQVYAIISRDCEESDVLKKLVIAGLKLQLSQLPSGRLSRIGARFVDPFRKLIAFNADLIVVSSGSAHDPVYQIALAKLLQSTITPFIFICHFNAETFWVDDAMRWAMKSIFQKAATSVFISKENLRITERQLAAQIPKAKIIPPPLNLNLFDPLPWPDFNENTPYRLACVARLEPRWKGQDVLFEVLSDSKWTGRNYLLSLFGNGSEEEYLRELVHFYGLEKKVVFAGCATPEKIWATHHLQILPTRGEGGPMVTIEGMMCGRVAVTTCCGHNSDYIIDGETGFLAAFSTTKCFGEKLEEAWERRSEWKAMGIKAHNFIRNRANDFNASEQLLSVILSERCQSK